MDASDSVARRRLEAIALLGLAERAGDPGLTAITRLASFVTGAAAAAVHIIDADHQHRIAAVDAPLGRHPREDSMCRLVVDGEQRIICADATEEPRFSYTSFVQGHEPVRFYASVPLRASGGAVVGTLCTWDLVPRTLDAERVALLEDLAETLAARIELLRIALDLGHAASHDPLTGAVNRFVLADRLAQAFARRLRRGGDVLVALVDVDRFKAINDTHGHLAGDAVLVEVARRLMASTRAHDTVARLGGDEFVIVAELDAGTGTATAVLERVRAGLGAPVAIGDGMELPVGVTIGTALAQPGDDVHAALGRADAAMYAAKPRRVAT